VREGDTVARLGGDEFVALVEGVQEDHHVGRIAEKILAAMSHPVHLKGYELVINTSIGISLFPVDGMEVEQLLKNADMAMYRAKELGGNQYQFFLPEMNQKAVGLLLLESHLRRAIEKNELDIAFQPKYTLRTRRLSGAEALIRWHNAELGAVMPKDFIPVAEETGMIIPLGEWVLYQACVHNRRWQDMGRAPLKVAVNISARQFRRTDLIDTVRRVLRETRIPGTCLEIEITESVAMKDPELAIEMLDGLRHFGVSTSIDDFGTGYSSLSYLKKFPIHSLKIDRSFVRDIASSPNDAAIVNSTIALAHAMMLPVVAEGIENDGQFKFLLRHGCDQGQGYLLGMPRPAEEFVGCLYTSSRPR
jgi:predicted signal transduction protein with EAL and GGDEF domain